MKKPCDYSIGKDGYACNFSLTMYLFMQFENDLERLTIKSQV